MHDRALVSALIERALKGHSITALASRLNVPGHLIADWREGRGAMPERKVLALIDLVERERL